MRTGSLSWLFVAAALLVNCGRAPSSHSVTSVAQLRRVSAEQVQAGIPVRITGILTYADKLSGVCFVQDSTGGVRVTLMEGQSPPVMGSKVRVSGLAGSGGEAPSVTQAGLADLGTAALPAASPAAGLRPGEHQYERVWVDGVVQGAAIEWNEFLAVEIRAAGEVIKGNLPSASNVTEQWADAEVRVTGILAWTSEPDDRGAHPVLWIPGLDAIEVRYAPAPVNSLPVTPIRTLVEADSARRLPHRVRIHGAKYVPVGGGIGVADATGRIPVHLAPDHFADDSSWLDMAGFVCFENGRPVLEQATPVLPETAGSARSGAWPAVLTTAREVHSLTREAAQRQYPIRLRGVVTYFNRPTEMLFVQDATDGIFVRILANDRLELKTGDLVEVTGVSVASFAPDVDKAHITVLGRAPMPRIRPESEHSAFLGREDSRWIQLGGIVRSVVQEEAESVLTLVWGNDRYNAHVLAKAEELRPLVDAEVELQGVCGALFNGKRQLMGIELYVPGKEHIRVLRPGAQDPFAIPARAIQDLLLFSGQGDAGHRVRVRGTVTFDDHAGSIWIQDSTAGVQVRDISALDVAPGDLVDAAGFPEAGKINPLLSGAMIRKVGGGAPPEPVHLSIEEAMKGGHDAQLVQVEGRLLERLRRPGEQVLTFASGGTVYRAIVANREGAPMLEPGALLRLTGICVMEIQETEHVRAPRAVHLVLRSPADITVLENAPLLTKTLLSRILAAVGFLALGALLWVRLLHKRVAAQTRDLLLQTKQLSEANRLTNAALLQAHEAESLELARKRILELVARDEPIGEIARQIADAAKTHSESALCAILVSEPEGNSLYTWPLLPATSRQKFEKLAGALNFGAEADCDGAGERVMAEALRGYCSERYRTVWARPIVVDGRIAGAIAVFFRDKREADAADEQLGAWCSIAGLALERRKLYNELSRRARYDALTGLPNRAILYEQLESQIASAGSGALLALLYADLDGFKEINDRFGHAAGDAVLQECARRMLENVRRGDTVARIGGDEFVLLLPMLRDREDAVLVAAKVADALEKPVGYGGQKLKVGVSLGISIWPEDGTQPDLLLRSADTRMYSEKKGKRRWYDGALPSETAGPRIYSPRI